MRQFRTHRRCEFADTDMGNLVHFSRFFVFMETAEHEFLRAVGLEVHSRIDGHLVGWPRLAAACEYVSPARYGDELDILLEVERKGRSSMTYRFTIACGGRLVARGRLTSVCCVLDDPAGLRAIPIPEPVAARIEDDGA
jgi:4-hydroxybenzoyl-CoA thioesterase/acyl-CoA thioester hydrolase